MEGFASLVEGKKDDKRLYVFIDAKSACVSGCKDEDKRAPKTLLKLDKNCETVLLETGGALRVLGKKGKTLLALRFDDAAVAANWHSWLHGRFKGLVVFGVSLLELAAREQLVEDEKRLPAFLELLLDRLNLLDALRDTHGIFRVPGNAERTAKTRMMLDGSTCLAVEAISALDPISAGALLKLFIKELPEPICTTKLYPYFLQYGGGGVPREQARFMVHELVWSIPTPNRVFFRRLVALMLAVSEHEASNDMSLRNLSIVFAPSVFRPPVGSGPAIEMRDTPRMLSTMLLVAEEFAFVFSAFENQEKDPFLKALERVATARLQSSDVLAKAVASTVIDPVVVVAAAAAADDDDDEEVAGEEEEAYLGEEEQYEEAWEQGEEGWGDEEGGEYAEEGWEEGYAEGWEEEEEEEEGEEAAE